MELFVDGTVAIVALYLRGRTGALFTFVGCDRRSHMYGVKSSVLWYRETIASRTIMGEQ